MATYQLELQPIPDIPLRGVANIPLILETGSDHGKPLIPSQHTHFFDPDELVGKTFLCQWDVGGTIHRAKIIERIENTEAVADQYLVQFDNGERTMPLSTL